MERLEIVAKTDNLPQVIGFIDERLEEAGCDMRIQLQMPAMPMKEKKARLRSSLN